MANQRIVNYMKTQLSGGFTLDQIKKGLMSQGWKRGDVEEAARTLPTKDSSEAEGGKMPGLVKVLSVLYYLCAAVFILGGIFLIFMHSLLSSLGLLGSLISMVTSFLGQNIFIYSGIFLVGMSVLYFFIGRGLWMGQNWARILVIIFSIISLLAIIPVVMFSLTSGYLITSIVEAVISGAIAGYLLFSKKVRDAFKKVE